MGGYSYRLSERIGFYASYFWYKLILPAEVRSPRLRMWWYELGYTLHKFRDYEYCMAWKSPVDLIATRFGDYKIRTGTNDPANVSPAFERRDVNQLMKKISGLAGAGKRVLFLDVGGDIGTYCVAVGNRFRNENVDVVCFEPVPANHRMALGNVERNQLSDKVEVMQLALMDEKNDHLQICLNTMAPGSSSISGTGEVVEVKADRMDAALQDRANKYDAIVMKLDVEGAEESVLRGASGILELGIETHLVVEDFVDPSIIPYLEQSGWDFRGKYTDYNSWWQKRP